MRILVTGANGQLGNEIRQHVSMLPQADFVFTDIAELDITNEQKVDIFVEQFRINYIVNCAAYTAVDKAEQEQDKAHLINADAVANLAKAAKKHHAFLVHVSTDYVFDGTAHKPYVENDPVNPTGAYGVTKLAGEEAVKKHTDHGIIIRTSWLYSNFGVNFLKTMQRLGAEKEMLNVVFDQVGTPTNAGDLAEAILKIIPQTNDWNEGVQIYHFSNEGVCSWYDFATEIMYLSKLKCKVFPIESKDYPTPTARPPYSVLNKAKIKQRFNLQIPHWIDSLAKVVQSQKN